LFAALFALRCDRPLGECRVTGRVPGLGGGFGLVVDANTVCGDKLVPLDLTFIKLPILSGSRCDAARAKLLNRISASCAARHALKIAQVRAGKFSGIPHGTFGNGQHFGMANGGTLRRFKPEELLLRPRFHRSLDGDKNQPRPSSDCCGPLPPWTD